MVTLGTINRWGTEGLSGQLLGEETRQLGRRAKRTGRCEKAQPQHEMCRARGSSAVGHGESLPWGLGVEQVSGPGLLAECQVTAASEPDV